VSESQKQELERYQATVERQEAELVEVRQQLAKLSEIVDRQTDDMKQLNIEARFVSDTHSLALSSARVSALMVVKMVCHAVM